MDDVECALVEMGAARQALEDCADGECGDVKSIIVAVDKVDGMTVGNVAAGASMIGAERQRGEEKEEKEVKALRQQVTALEQLVSISTDKAARLQGFFDGISKVNDELRVGIEAMLAEKAESEREMMELRAKFASALAAAKAGTPHDVKVDADPTCAVTTSTVDCAVGSEKASSPPGDGITASPHLLKTFVSSPTRTEGTATHPSPIRMEPGPVQQLVPITPHGTNSDEYDEWRVRVHSSLAKSKRLSTETVQFIRKVQSDVARRHERLSRSGFRRQVKEETAAWATSTVRRRQQQRILQASDKEHGHESTNTPIVARKLDFDAANSTNVLIRRVRSELADRPKEGNSINAYAVLNLQRDEKSESPGNSYKPKSGGVELPTPMIARRLDFDESPDRGSSNGIEVVRHVSNSNPAVFGNPRVNALRGAMTSPKQLENSIRSNNSSRSNRYLASLTDVLPKEVTRG